MRPVVVKRRDFNEYNLAVNDLFKRGFEMDSSGEFPNERNGVIEFTTYWAKFTRNDRRGING